MYPFWDVAIAPVLEAVDAKRVLEIGAWRGETTELMLDRLLPHAELHVIDPVPEFDPAEHQERFAGRYIFHRDLSLNVLPDLPAVDVALVDGDHNWYTVYNELRLLRAAAARDGAPLPVLILHDVCWPYGRRDLYYAPEQIPEEFRQPYAQRGMRPDRAELLPRGGGMNPTMYNALVEGGPRNGVMTALDDFIAEYDRPLRRIVLPVYYGLAIVAEEARIATTPALAQVLERLESADGRRDLLEITEDMRLKSMVFQHSIGERDERRLKNATRRYLDLLKGALLNEHHLENEVRIMFLARAVDKKYPIVNPLMVRDPARYMAEELRAVAARRRAGNVGFHDDTAYFPYTTMGRVRLDALERVLDVVRSEEITGDFVDCGAGRCGAAIFMRGYIDVHELGNRRVWVVDSFRSTQETEDGALADALGGGPGFPEFRVDLNTARDAFQRFGLLDDRVRFVMGEGASALTDAPVQQVAVLRLGGTGSDAVEILDALYPKLVIGGYVVIDQYGLQETAAEVDAFRARRGVDDPIERIDTAGAFWRKTRPARVGARETPAESTAGHAPLARAVPAAARRDLTVVVVFYNMKREAARTLHSLSRAYQRDVDDLDYEVIVLENGSREEQKLAEAFVCSFGPEFRYVDLGEDATPSPVTALNRGIALGTGDAFALMIDGAHVLTPRVLHFGLTGLRTYEPAIVATQQWYVGPGHQGDAMMAGYDEDFEDRLFDEIKWPTDGYQLFNISHFVGDRDWFDGLWESNCLFVTRKQLEQVGGFDESWSVAGGGYANLELYERLGAAADIRVVTILGEASFHQTHGGTTTNQADIEERRRRISGYAQDFARMRGRPFRGPGKIMHYVGAMPTHAIRTKGRRRAAPNIFKVGRPDVDGVPQEPLPIPLDLKIAYVDAVWRSLAWQRTTWLGHPIENLPTDLVAYQELVTRLRPDWIVETRTKNGARALFFASVCEMLGHGQVLSIDASHADELPQHPRITYLTGDPIKAETARRVHDVVGNGRNALVVLGGTETFQRLQGEFRHYAPLVPIGGYLVFENTLVNGNPVWPSFGAGPGEIVKHLMNTSREFAPDPEFERYGLTFNSNGFLRRLH